jgi:hypothetical protein
MPPYTGGLCASQTLLPHLQLHLQTQGQAQLLPPQQLLLNKRTTEPDKPPGLSSLSVLYLSIQPSSCQVYLRTSGQLKRGLTPGAPAIAGGVVACLSICS